MSASRTTREALWPDLRFYWLSDKPIVLWHTALDAITLDAPAQAGIIADLNARRIQYAVLEDTQFYGTETGYIGSTMLDEYLASHFQPMATPDVSGFFAAKWSSPQPGFTICGATRREKPAGRR